MSVELIKYAFIAGELSRTLFGRTDLTKYDLGMALARNWFVDYRGGLSTRAGTEFLDFIKFDQLETKFVEFRFSPDLSNTYLLLFGHNYVRFVQDGAYVLEDAKSAVPSAANKITSTAHGYANSDWVKISNSDSTILNGRSFIISNVTANTFELNDPGSTLPVSFPVGTTATVARIYEVATPYPSAALESLNTYQIRDLLRLTHTGHPIRNLIRHDHTNWSLEAEVSLNAIPRPTNVVGDATEPVGTQRAGVVYAVSAVMENGEEGPTSIPILMQSIVNFTIEAGSVYLTWDPVPDARSYRIYRSYVSTWKGTSGGPTNRLSAGEELGYLGASTSPNFTDSNIIPDFTTGPIEPYSPFTVGGVEHITVTNGGTGYAFAPNIMLSGGNGFLGYAVTNNAGEIISVVIQREGQGYTNGSTLTVAGAGTGATFTIKTREEEGGRNPSISSLFQQRQMYAASLSSPLTVWGSRIRRYSDFTDSSTDSSSYEFELDSAEVAPIRHMLSMRGGLLLMSQTGIWLLTGSPQGGPVTPSNALADPQDYTGVSAVPPLKIGTDLLYIEGRGTSVRLLSYNDFAKVYSGEDQSILSNHLFSAERQITKWTFADNPGKNVYAVRSDGVLLMFTIVKEQEVFAWTWGTTQGQFKDVISISEDGYDRVYTTVRRLIGGRWRRYLERFAKRQFTHIEDAWAVDAGLALTPPSIQTSLAISIEYTIPEMPEAVYVNLLAGAPIFTGREGQFVRASGGIFIISEVLSATSARAYVREPATNTIPEDPKNRVIIAEIGEWTMGPGYSTIGGLDHLEGMTVSILGDGNVFPPQTVVGGQVTLPEAVSKAIVGLGFRAIAQTLPPVVNDVPVEAKRKRVVGTAVRLNESRGLLAGRTLDELYEFKNRTTEGYGAPTRVINGFKHILLSTDWDENGQTYFVQDDPLPASILGLIPDLEFGDDNN